MRGKKDNLKGIQLGKLTVVEEAEQRSPTHKVIWKCACECGNEIYLPAYTIKRGKIKDCGACNTLPRTAIDLTGKRFGMLKVQYPERDRINGCMKWHCQCDCGNECTVDGRRLRGGMAISCGCVKTPVKKKRGGYSGLDIPLLDNEPESSTVPISKLATDYTGYRKGQITVIEPTNRRCGANIVWKCLCDCGNTLYLDSRTIKNGKMQDCGCNPLSKSRTKDLTGKRFGQLTCQYPEKNRDPKGSIMWHCLCDCGKECSVSAASLLSENTKSCGCNRQDITKIKDFIGKQFGNLEVIEYAGKKDGMHQWKCRCACGNIIIAGQTPLQRKITRSCGCTYLGEFRESKKLYDRTSILLLERILDGKPIKTNTSGFTGVYYSEKTGKWDARIEFKGKKYHLGTFDNKEEAIHVRKRAEEELFEPTIEEYYSIIETEENPTD